MKTQGNQLAIGQIALEWAVAGIIRSCKQVAEHSPRIPAAPPCRSTVAAAATPHLSRNLWPGMSFDDVEIFSR